MSGPVGLPSPGRMAAYTRQQMSPMPDLPSLRYLTAPTSPPRCRRWRSGWRSPRRTLIALVADAELPPKIGVHPRPDGSFGHAMPAYLRGADRDGADDRVGMKWMSPSRNNERGLPAIHGLVLLTDPVTGVPTAILDAGPITAERTAATSGVAIARFAPRVDGRAPRAALIGAGVQGRSHVPVLGHVLPGVRLAVFDRHPDRAEALAAVARTATGSRVRAPPPTRGRRVAADVVVTAASFARRPTPGDDRRLAGRRDASSCPSTTRRTAPHRSPATPRCSSSTSATSSSPTARPASSTATRTRPRRSARRSSRRPAGRPAGRVVVTHLGVGLADLVFGDAILAAAEPRGLGRSCRADGGSTAPPSGRLRRRARARPARRGRRRDGRMDRAGGAARRPDRDAAGRVRGRSRPRDVRRPDADQPLRARRGRLVHALGPRVAGAAGGRSRPRPARSCSARPARCGSRARTAASSTPRSRPSRRSTSRSRC